MNTTPGGMAEAAKNNKPIDRHSNVRAKTGPPQQFRDANLLIFIGLSSYFCSLSVEYNNPVIWSGLVFFKRKFQGNSVEYVFCL
jgi:hypothetical protein